MNSQELLTVNAVGAGAFILWYVLARGGGKAPTQLDMTARDSAPPLINKPESFDLVPNVERAPIFHPDRTAVRTKNLNVMFNYNGHSWDAHEVLGVPAGASIKSVTDAYQAELRRCDKASIEFLETAYKAILHKGS